LHTNELNQCINRIDKKDFRWTIAGTPMNATTATVDTLNLEAVLPPVAAALMVVYLGTFFVILLRHPLRVNLGLKMAIRRRWARHVVQDNQALTAVQTLRNSQNAAGVFASAAVIVAFFSFQQGSNLCTAGQALQGVKFYVLGATLVASFIVFGISIREAEQCGYLSYAKAVTKEWEDIEVPIVPRSVDSNAMMRREMTIADLEARCQCRRAFVVLLVARAEVFLCGSLYWGVDCVANCVPLHHCFNDLFDVFFGSVESNVGKSGLSCVYSFCQKGCSEMEWNMRCACQSITQFLHRTATQEHGRSGDTQTVVTCAGTGTQHNQLAWLVRSKQP
jgi:hypothetical protein